MSYEDIIKTENKKDIGELFGNVGQSRSTIYFKISF